ncbi:calcium-dependent phosphotriesterase [Exidia glandulosa HHB12029]|uniref:Calcium-dependent phosphotriesterase n=1 Tax=Exidia glandulosa HHB12029 TaxID=1314781 RepID=A0A166BE72_EXIGL|nr:calcium-dependent phosphotriesterase [Exidia glandulosa HHB12029]
MCGRILLSLLTLAVAVFGALYALYFQPLIVMGGRGRVIEPVANSKCAKDKSIQACEKLVLHEPSGLVYMACSMPHLRSLWLPNHGLLNKTGAGFDYLAVYNPATESASRVPLVRFAPSPEPVPSGGTGLSVLGLDVVSSGDPENPHEVFVYVVNNRPPAGNAWAFGPNSVVEIFKGEAGKSLKHVATVRDPLIGIPNDVLGSPDGKSFWITNDKKKGSLQRGLDIIFGRPSTTVTFCRVDEGCKTAARNLRSSNGIAKGPQGEIYVTSTYTSQIYVFEAQADDTLVLTDTIPIGGGGLDNLSVDSEGSIYVAEYPKVFHAHYRHLENPKILSPSAVLKISLNTDESAYYGQKYKIEKIFEDDGKVANGVTTAAYDKERNKLYMHGIASPAFLNCEL